METIFLVDFGAETLYFELSLSFAIRKVELNAHYTDHSTSLLCERFFWATYVLISHFLCGFDFKYSTQF